MELRVLRVYCLIWPLLILLVNPEPRAQWEEGVGVQTLNSLPPEPPSGRVPGTPRRADPVETAAPKVIWRPGSPFGIQGLGFSGFGAWALVCRVYGDGRAGRFGYHVPSYSV